MSEINNAFIKRLFRIVILIMVHGPKVGFRVKSFGMMVGAQKTDERENLGKKRLIDLDMTGQRHSISPH